MRISTRKTALAILVFALAIAALVAVAPRLGKFALEKINVPLQSSKFDIKGASADGYVRLTIEGQRFKIPQRYVSGVTTWRDGSVASVNVRLVLPGLEPYDPDNKQHRYEFSPYIGGGWRNKLYLTFGGRHSVPLDELFSRNVEFKKAPPFSLPVTPRSPELDDPKGVDIYSSPNKQEPPDRNGRVWWRSGNDYFVIQNGQHTIFFAQCDREVPEQFPGCKVYADFGPELNAEYEYGRPHFVRDWKHIHDHITGLIRSWMETDRPDSNATLHSR